MRESDLTKNIATPAVIVAAIRSGGTFLAHCLSNHPQIFCDRAESLHHKSVWCTSVTTNRRHILAALLNQSGYRASMCKLTYSQAFHDEIWPWLLKRKPYVIWLYRTNLLRQAVSVYLNQQTRQAGALQHPQHSFEEVEAVRVSIEPTLFLKYVRGLAQQNRQAQTRVSSFEHVLTLTYDQVSGGEGLTARKLPPSTGRMVCEFLGVSHSASSLQAMACDLKRINPYPLREMIANWGEVERAILASEFSPMLDDEAIWPTQ